MDGSGWRLPPGSCPRARAPPSCYGRADAHHDPVRPDLEGRSDDDAWRIHDEIDAAWLTGGDGVFPGGEDLPTALGRFGGALRMIVERVGDGRAVVVGHGGIMRIGAANLFREPAADPITDPIANASIIEMELDLEEDRLRGRILGWSRGDHLAAVG